LLLISAAKPLLPPYPILRGGTSLLHLRGGGAIMKPPPPHALELINREEEEGVNHLSILAFIST